MSDVVDRIAGGLLGVHAGDSLGATVEFQPWAAIREAYPNGHRDIVGGGPFGWSAGAATDDTDLTRAVLLGYREQPHGGPELIHAVADGMLRWSTGDWPGRTPGSRPIDIGMATSTGLQRYADHGDPYRSGAGHGSAGNGSLMRCVVTGLIRADQTRRRDESAAISAITHDDARCDAACIVYNDIVAALVAGAPAAAALAAGAVSARAERNVAVVDALELGRRLDLAAMARAGTGALPDGGRGFVLDSLALGIAALADPRPLEDVLVDVVALGGDTDTNAAVAGGLRGCLDGASAIPSRWIERLQFGAEFRTDARWIAERRSKP